MNPHRNFNSSWLWGTILISALLVGCSPDKPEPPAVAAGMEFVQVNGTQFTRKGQPYYFIGANFWQGMNLGSKGPGGDRTRLVRELDRMKSLGIRNLRILGASEGPDTEPWRVTPSLQPSPNQYNEQVLDGLDFLLSEMARRDMQAVVMLNNFWPWSGGMAQYLRWQGGGPIPYPPPQPGGNWDTYQNYTAAFYSNAQAKANFRRHIRFLIERTNPYTGKPYRDDPTIMAWQLANEPRGNNRAGDFNLWINETAAFIKSLDRNHLVSLGAEGDTPWPAAVGLEFSRNHASANIDYATIHLWPVNWNWYDARQHAGTFAPALEKTRAYLASHLDRARALNKPLVVEEFGMARDQGSFDSASATQARNQFYGALYEEAYRAAQGGAPLAGTNFWAWAGAGRPLPPGGLWKPGDPLIGDPPHEHQGWNSVYDTDAGTLRVIADFAARFAQIGKQ